MKLCIFLLIMEKQGEYGRVIIDRLIRYERLAAIVKKGTQIRLQKKDDVLFRVPF